MKDPTSIEKLNYIFTRSQKIKLFGLVILILIGAAFELLGVSLIFPFISIVTNPDSIESSSFLASIYHLLNMKSNNDFLIIIAVSLIIIYIIKNVYAIYLFNIQCKFIYRNQLKLSTRLMESYMSQPYLYHVQKNTAEFQRSIQTDVQRVFALVMSFIQLFSELAVACLLMLYLMIVDMEMTCTIVLLLVLCMVLYLGLYRKKIIQCGMEVQLSGSLMIKSINQAFSGIKDIKVLGREQFFVDTYGKYANRNIESQRKNEVLSQVPRHVIEMVCIGGILSIIIAKLLGGGDMSKIIPQLSAFAVAAFRLLPSANRISSHTNTIVFQKASIDLVYHDLKEGLKNMETRNSLTSKEETGIKMNSLNICNVSFTYPEAKECVIDNISFSIPLGTSIALIGPSGAGKTTLADIILGLLSPQKGGVYYEDKLITANKELWMQKIAYVPQFIYLADDTIRNNIAFGITESEINDDIIYETLQQAQLYEFVLELPDGLETIIGEQGIRMSGGQRQRLGIARALYTNPEIVIFDEATSALDTETENALMEAIDYLRGQKTLIIIAHRLQTIKKCDDIYSVENKTITRRESILEV